MAFVLREFMKDFIFILFFAKTILLTPDSMSIMRGEVVLEPDEEITAITKGASLQIDVSSNFKWSGEPIKEFRGEVKKKFPAGTIKAVLFSKNHGEVELVYTGSMLINKDEVLLSLYGVEGVPVDVGFHKVVIFTEIDLEGVKVIWKNHKN